MVFRLVTVMAESKPFVFSSTTDSSSAAPAQSNVRRTPKPERSKRSWNRGQSSALSVPPNYSEILINACLASIASTSSLGGDVETSSSVPAQSNAGRNPKPQRSKRNSETKISSNQNQSSVNSLNLTSQSTELVDISSAKPSTPDPAFSTPSPRKSVQIVDGNNPFSSIASRSSLLRDVEASSSVPESEQSLIVVSRILNGIPQSPHFYQLRNFSELTRKSLISGWDEAFLETVEELQSLQVADFWVKAKELWRTMAELQSMGYGVILLRRRLVELTDVLVEFKLAQMEVKRLKTEAENHRLESSRLESIALRFQEMAKEEKETVDKLVIEAAKKEDELPNLDACFAKLTKDPL